MLSNCEKESSETIGLSRVEPCLSLLKKIADDLLPLRFLPFNNKITGFG